MNPFSDVIYLPPTLPSNVSAYATQLAGNFQALQVGSGNQSYKADRDGIWLGAETFALAPFSVDMAGNVFANSIMINGLSGAVIAGAINDVGNIITTSLNTQTKQIMGEFTFTGSGALAIRSDSNNGLWLSPTGFLAKKAGATTFAIDLAGNATFSGTITASSITGGTINGGTITGAYIQTAASGYRVILNGTAIMFYTDNTANGSIAPDGTGSMLYSSTANHLFFGAGGAGLMTLNTDGLTLSGGRNLFLQANQRVQWSSGRYIDDDGSRLTMSGDWLVKGGYYIKPGSTTYAGATFTGLGFVTAVESSRAKWRSFDIRGGIITNVGGESGWG